jgi:hypothetical protein
VFSVKATGCRHSNLYGVIGIHSKEACMTIQ